MKPGSTFIPTLITALGVTVLVGMGTWQLQRRAWKAELIATLDARLSAAPAPLPTRIDDADAWTFRPVTVTGRYLPGGDMLVTGRPHQGRAGYALITPLIREDGGTPVLIDRGFVPLEWKDPAARAPTPSEAMTITGIARFPAARVFGQADNQPATGAGAAAWSWFDAPAMARSVGLEAVTPLVVERLPSPPDTPNDPPFPAAHPPRAELPDNHLQYAITWYGLASALLVIHVLWRRRRNGESPT